MLILGHFGAVPRGSLEKWDWTSNRAQYRGKMISVDSKGRVNMKDRWLDLGSSGMGGVLLAEVRWETTWCHSVHRCWS